MIKGMTFILLLSAILQNQSFGAKRKSLSRGRGVYYYNQFYGHLHENPFRFSNVLTTISCGHPVNLHVDKKGEDGIAAGKNWSFVKVGPYKGFIEKELLSKSRPKCFQDEFPKFFHQFKLEITDIYYWGRLYDHFSRGRSKIQ